MAAPPAIDDLAPLLGGTGSLDAPSTEADPEEEGAEFNAAAMSAVGTRQKAQALRDAFDAYCREKGLVADDSDDEEDSYGGDQDGSDEA
jgi:hypothetical protein